MKRIYWITSLILMTLLLAGCGKNNKQVASNESTEGSEITTTEKRITEAKKITTEDNTQVAEEGTAEDVSENVEETTAAMPEASSENTPPATETETTPEIPVTEEPVTEAPTPALTQEQAYTGVKNYCYASNPDLRLVEEEGYYLYWELTGVTDTEYTITYRSYTGAFMYFHVDIASGNVTTTEYVPGITDGEVPGTVTFNVWDYLN